jgi:hypothetical protein
VTHTPVTNREIAYRDIAIPVALVHGTLQVPNPDMVTPVLHYLPRWPTRLSRRDIVDHDSNVWEFLTSGNSDAPNFDSSGSIDTCSPSIDGPAAPIGISRFAISKGVNPTSTEFPDISMNQTPMDGFPCRDLPDSSDLLHASSANGRSRSPSGFRDL